MPFMLHVILAVSYCLLAAAATLLLPVVLPHLAPGAAPFVGVGTVAGGMLFHFLVAQMERNRRVADELQKMRQQARRLAEDLLETQTQSLHVKQAMEQAGKAGEQRVSQVIAEVKVLQGLVEAFSEHQQEYVGIAAASGGRPQLVAVGSQEAGERPPMPPLAEHIGEPELSDILREALRRDRVDVYLQPIVSLPQRKTRYYECYTRIRAADGTVVGPRHYIAIARREGLVSAIDNLQLFRCVQLIRRTQSRNYDTAFFCNISSDSLSDTAFIADFVDFVADNRELAPSLFFEIGQADLDNAPAESVATLARLAQLGFRFSLDHVTHLNLDFAGLAARNFRFVKIDAHQLLDPANAIQSDIAVGDIKERFDRHGLNLIVAKIEAENELVELLDYNIDYGQGYLFGEPRLSRID